MRKKYTLEEFEHIESLVECALTAPTKAEAKKYLSKLDYITFEVEAYSRGVLSEVKATASAASGRVQDKERLVQTARWYLNKLKIHCVE